MRYRLMFRYWLISVVATLCVTTTTAFCVDQDEYGEFLASACHKWNEYLHLISKMECAVFTTSREDPAPEKKYETVVVFDFPCFAMENIKEGQIQEVDCYGKKYHFRLKRNEINGKFEITKLQKNLENVKYSSWENLFYKSAFSNDEWGYFGGRNLRIKLGGSLYLAGPVSLPQLVQCESFKIKNLTEDSDKIYVDYQFEPSYDISDNADYLLPIRSGRFVLSKESYLLNSAEFGMAYGDPSDSYCPKRIKCEYVQSGNRWVLKSKNSELVLDSERSFATVASYENIRLKKQRSSRFTLSYYGLPEPNFDDDRMFLIRLILVILGCMLIAYAVLDFYRTKRLRI